MQTYSQVAVLARAIAIADQGADVFKEQWVVVRKAHQFEVVPSSSPWLTERGAIVYVTLR